MFRKLCFFLTLALLCVSAADAEPKHLYKGPFPTKISQLADVHPGDPCYSSLKNLVENHGICFSFNDGLFHADKGMKRGDFAKVLSDALLTSRQKLDSISLLEKLPVDVYQQLQTASFSLHGLKFKGGLGHLISQVPDANSKAPWNPSVGFLLEQFQVDFLDADHKLRPNDFISENDALRTLVACYGGKVSQPLGSAPILRGELCVYLNAALSAYSERIKGSLKQDK